jgi:regulatory protein
MIMTNKARQKQARVKVMDLLARRGHSTLELRQKMALRFSPEEIEDAILFAEENNWMTPPHELAERVVEELSRKKKGQRYIQQFLKRKGLPTVAPDRDVELQKGRDIAEAKIGRLGPYDFEEQRKIYRLLVNRGFDAETIRAVLGSLE